MEKRAQEMSQTVERLTLARLILLNTHDIWGVGRVQAVESIVAVIEKQLDPVIAELEHLVKTFYYYSQALTHKDANMVASLSVSMREVGTWNAVASRTLKDVTSLLELVCEGEHRATAVHGMFDSFMETLRNGSLDQLMRSVTLLSPTSDDDDFDEDDLDDEEPT
jgi:hypothetical protein